MNLFKNRYYNLNRKLLKFIGLWPYQKPVERRIRTSIMNVILTIAMVAQILNVSNAKIDIDLFVNSSMFLLPTICIIAIYSTSYTNKRKLKLLVDRILVDWNESKPEELKIFQEYAGYSRLCTRILIISFYTPLIALFILSIIPYIVDDLSSPTKRHPHTFFYPVKTLINKEKYPYINLLLVNLLILVVGIISLANYTLYLALVHHACAIFRVTGYILEHLITETEHDLSCLMWNNEIYLKIARGIEYHKRALEFTEILNSVSSFCYLVQVAISMIIVAIDIMGVLQARGNLKSANKTIFCLLHISGMICWLFFNCIVGQQVVDHSFIVFEKTSTIPWYLLPPRIQKLAIILLMKSTKPSYLSIGKMFISSHEFFVSTIQTSVSYGMILHNV